MNLHDHKLSCHPEHSEGSWSPASQILRYAQDDSADCGRANSLSFTSTSCPTWRKMI